MGDESGKRDERNPLALRMLEGIPWNVEESHEEGLMVKKKYYGDASEIVLRLNSEDQNPRNARGME